MSYGVSAPPPAERGQRRWGAWLAMLLTAPLALILGIHPGAANAVAGPSKSAAVPEPAEPALPSEDCARRFLGPFEDLSGDNYHAPFASAPPSVEVLLGTDAGSPVVLRHAQSTPAPDWLEVTTAAIAATSTRLGAQGQVVPVDAMIATIPDPIDTGLSYQFDTMLQALRLGLERTDDARKTDPSLYRARSWLPWRDVDASGSTRASSANCRWATPGLLVFRSSTPQTPRLRLVLLVGETPTSGVHAAAMSNALRLASALNSKFEDPPDASVDQGASSITKIVGPTFSGGATSLRVALNRWAVENGNRSVPFAVHIVTGTASGSALETILGSTSNWPPPLKVRFDATTLPESAIECAYLFRLKQMGADVGRRSAEEQTATLNEVAMLYESGTEFGATVEGQPDRWQCPLKPGVQVSFPVHIASLRDAYEDLDKRSAERESIARATSLDVSLRESRRAPDPHARPSPKTTFAQDIALANVLTQLSIDRVRFVGIHATDVADAIFLARKIRDVVPDVRLAFFEADALLQHPEYQDQLRGSLIVSPYPFLGSNHFTERAPFSGQPSYMPFENSTAVGAFNAVLALRGWRFDRLLEYALPSLPLALPVWISVIGRDGFVPLGVTRAVDCERTIYSDGSVSASQELLDRLCKGNAEEAERKEEAWREYNTAQTSDVRPNVRLPRAWHFLFGLLLLGFGTDQALMRRARRRLAPDAFPLAIDDDSERKVDLAIGRTKWLLYAGIRSLLFTLAFLYVACFYIFSCAAAGQERTWLDWAEVTIALTALFLSALLTVHAHAEFAQDYTAFAKMIDKRPRIFGMVLHLYDPVRLWVDRTCDWLFCAASAQTWTRVSAGKPPNSAPPSDGRIHDKFVLSRLHRVLAAIGFAQPTTGWEAAETSFAQLRLIVFLAFGSSTFFTACLLLSTANASQFALALKSGASIPALVLLLTRTSSLANGVSPAAPALFCLGCVYSWAVGRMARLEAAHATARLSPPDGVDDLVSTPLSSVLYPDPTTKEGNDEGFSKVECSVGNAIWRPITGPYYLTTVAVLILVLVLLFLLKRPNTVEPSGGTTLLMSGLALSTILIGVTLIQLIRYWLSLEPFLKRVMQHPLGRALATARPFVRESVDGQLSRAPDDLLRLVACSRLFDGLMLKKFRPWRFESGFSAAEELEKRREQLVDARAQALGAHQSEGSAEAAAKLGQEVLLTARVAMRLVSLAWQGNLRVRASRLVESDHRMLAAAAEGHIGVDAVVALDANESRIVAGSHSLVEAPPPPRFPRAVKAIPAVRVAASITHGQAAASDDADSTVDDALSPGAWQLEENAMEWLRSCQTFVATVAAFLISRYVRQFRYFLYALTAGTALLLLALNSYVFEPHRLLLTCSWAVVASVTIAGVWIFIELDRNTVLSYIAGTAPGKLTIDGALVVRIAAWGVLPILGLAATTYPEIANALYRLLEPFVRALR